MGRSVNSFSHYTRHAVEIDGDRVELPEKDLWIAVLARAALDAFKGPPRLNMGLRSNITHKNHYDYNKDQARHFFLHGGAHFNEVCEMAGRNPQHVKEKARKIILRANGWNVDVPVTSHYRQGRGKNRGRKPGRPKKLTGNSYYAAMGKKGGRPKLYE